MRDSVRAGVRHAAAVSLLSIAAILLSGCEQKVDLYFAADIRRASEMASVLGAHRIAVERKREKAGVMLSVASSDFPRAMEALREAGLLRPDRPSVDEALGKRGIAPTPLEERARYVHAIERELENALMDIDGVVAARMRIVPPERPAPGAARVAASASVLVKHRADVDLTPLVPGIVQLVKNGVPGLAGEDDRRVAIVLVPERRAAATHSMPEPRRTDWSSWLLVPLVCGAMGIGYIADRLLRRVRARVSEGGRHDASPG